MELPKHNHCYAEVPLNNLLHTSQGHLFFSFLSFSSHSIENQILLQIDLSSMILAAAQVVPQIRPGNLFKDLKLLSNLKFCHLSNSK
jgi:hypothetical protein